ncbi:hypothetical protein Q4603_05620 [Zobellia galactanivorans]|uniref:hypothetical protein n=1 Tax=Zobellia galactanivorans (strain DSM 12802 / CCUG 47099 / CIP 106680 / NCIMB 13871 / Dsij) TaxID=63186 RepID=UPI0026E417F7|nr:hypothetical protein [Zobellia galactanivorans]MDO6808073.1 hypothetical protein [Zobellia galactanivorans]
MSTLQVLRGDTGQIVAELPIDEGTVLVHKLMGEHRVDCTSIVSEPVDVRIGDYIEHQGELFYINVEPAVKKINNFTYEYTIAFEGEVYLLYNKLFLDEGASDFSYTGKVSDFMRLIVSNMNEISQGWSYAAYPDEIRTISFSADNCRTALSKILEEFNSEFRLSGRQIVVSPAGDVLVSNYRFEYGRGKGLYSIERIAIDRANMVTRAYGYGGRKNLGPDYRSGSNRLLPTVPYLEANTAIYGIREGIYTNDDLYPQRTGSVSAIDVADPFSFVDASLDFDINDYLLEGTVAKVVFKSGDLAGNEFEIKRYLNGDKKLFIIPFSEESGYVLPNELNRPRVGDTYTLVDIEMPESYKIDAEEELDRQLDEYIKANSVPKVTYGVALDEKYMRDEGIVLQPRTMVNVIDADLGIDADLRVTEVSYPILYPLRVTAVISDDVTYTVQERLIKETVDNGKVVKNVDLRRAELSRRTAGRFRELQDLVFDADGYFDGTKLKPNSVETLYLSVGAKSQNFGLSGVVIDPQPGGSSANLIISAGQLVHYEIEIEGVGYIWEMNAGTITGLDPSKPYYVYARCNRSTLSGLWVALENPIKTDAYTGMYHFYVGILYAEKDGRRDFDFTNGMTYINGDTITTGKIKSVDGQSYFDLSQGQFRAGGTDSSIDWNVTTPGRLTIKGSILQTATGEDINLANHKGAYSTSETYYKGDTVTYNGKVYINITDSATNNIAPTNSVHWSVYVEKGADGQSGSAGPSIVYRGEYSASALYYNNSDRRDVVKRSGVYYIYKGNNASTAAFSASNWDNFGAQFDSVATNLLLAENANIADWIIKDGKITSQDENSRLYGAEGRIHLYGSAEPGYSNISRIEGEGISVTGRGIPTLLPDNVTFNDAGEPQGVVLNSLAALSGSNKETGSYSDPRYGVVGRSSDANEHTLGGFFTSSKSLKLYTERIIRKVVRTATSMSLSNPHHIVITTHNSGTATITLPSGPETGREIIVKRGASGAAVISGGTKYLWDNGSLGTSEAITTSGESWKVVYDGTYWQVFKNKH